MKTIFTGILVFYSVFLLSQNVFIRDVECNMTDLLDSVKIEDAFYSAYAENQLRILNLLDSLAFLEKKYGQNKIIPEEIKAPVLCALSYYPELESSMIRFKYKSIRGTMNARPMLSNLLFIRFDREYVVVINDNKGKTKGLEYNDLSFNTKVGWFGHEFAHIAAFQSMRNWQIMKFSMKYFTSKKFLQIVERYTDYLAITHGLAFAIYDGALFQKRQNDNSVKFKRFSAKSFLAIHEIICFWQSMKSANTFETSK